MYDWLLQLGLPKGYIWTMAVASTAIPLLVFVTYLLSRKGMGAAILNALSTFVIVLILGGIFGMFYADSFVKVYWYGAGITMTLIYIPLWMMMSGFGHVDKATMFVTATIGFVRTIPYAIVAGLIWPVTILSLPVCIAEWYKAHTGVSKP